MSQPTSRMELLRNPISAIGALLAAINLALGAALLVVHFLEPRNNPYFGIFLFLVVPGMLFTGLLLIPLGVWREVRRLKRGGAPPANRWPVLDLNRANQRRLTAIVIVVTTVVSVVSALGAYSAYHYSESVEFCGTTCHIVMEPEHTAYQNSPHARVTCAQCHVGPGADWFVKAKISGAYQVYATLANKYPRPIPTPVRNLRPAQETCEQCHWPGRVYGGQLKSFSHTRYDEANTEWPINLLIKTGGNDPASGTESAGIHWHMNVGVDIDYVARDEQRQDIPWVRVKDRKTGRVTVYQDQSSPLSEAELQAATFRRMDCVDCHNRPSHIYLSPDASVDLALQTGALDRSLPSVKQYAVAAMAADYPDREAAAAGIGKSLSEAYQQNHPEIWNQERERVDRAVAAVQEAYGKSIFPEMKTRWSVYPDNIGHFVFKGCMRCHAGNHVAESGAVVSHDCRACHNILAQGSGDRAQVASTPEGLEFEHPEDIGEEWRETGCYECHSGTQP